MKSIFILLLIFLLSPVIKSSNKDNGIVYRNNLIDYIADEYVPPSLSIGDPEKYYYPIALARFSKYGVNDSIANKYVSLLAERGVFHFSSIGLVRILYEFNDAPSIRTRLPEIVLHHLEGNLWESEGTENHLNMERTSGFLIAQMALDILPNKMDLAKERYNQMKDWIISWGNRFLKYGAGEWNSSIYQAYSIVGWLNLLDFSKDRNIALLAEKVVNAYVEELAMNYSWGIIGGAEMRGKGILSNNIGNEASDYFCRLWFSSDFLDTYRIEGSGALLAIHPILSEYKPTSKILKMANKNNLKKTYLIEDTRPSYLYEDSVFVKRCLFVDKDFTLGSFMSEYGGYTGASSQIVPWKLVIKNGDRIPYQITGNGCYNNEWSGKGRAPYTQWIQYRNTLFMLTSVPENVDLLENLIDSVVCDWKKLWRKDYDVRFPGNNKINVVNRIKKENINLENSCFVSLPNMQYFLKGRLLIQPLGNVYVVVRFINDPNIVSIEKWNERLLLVDKALRGNLCGAVIEVIRKEHNIEEIYDIMNSKEISIIGKSLLYETYSGVKLQVSMEEYGTFIEPLYDWGYGTYKKTSMQKSPPMRQPDWMEGKGLGKVPSIIVLNK